jgi:hypothetical protein
MLVNSGSFGQAVVFDYLVQLISKSKLFVFSNYWKRLVNNKSRQFMKFSFNY